MDDVTRVLIVEDEAITAEDIRQRLESMDYQVPTVVTSGEEAVRAAIELRPNVVLMDIKLQGEMDGVEAAAQIHARCGIPVVYLTAHADEHVIERAKITEPFGYIPKPFHDRDLRVNIEIALYKHEQERKLRESEKRYRAVSELTSDYVYAIRVAPDGALEMEWTTEGFSRITGYAEELPMQDRLATLIHPDDRVKVQRHLQACLANQPGTVEVCVITKGGDTRWVRDYLRPVWDEAEKRVVHIYGAAQDVTERKRAEEALQQRSHALGEWVKELNCLYDISRLTERPGTSLDESLQGIADLIPPAWQYPEVTCARITLEGREFRTTNFAETAWKQHADIIVRGEQLGAAEVCYLEERPVSNGALKSEGPFLEEERDLLDTIAKHIGYIVEQVWVDKTLQESEEKYRSLFEGAEDHIFVVDQDFRYVMVNPSALRAGGFALEDVVGKGPREVFPEDAEFYLSQYRHVFETGAPVCFERELRLPDGPHWFSVTLSPIKSAQGCTIALTGISRDITERRRAEEELRQYREHLEELVEERITQLRRANEQLEQEVTEHKRAREALQESKEQWRSLYQNSPIPTYVWQGCSEDLVLMNYNDAALAITRDRIRDFVGMKASEMHKDRPDIIQDLLQCFTEKIMIEREMLYWLRATGEDKHFVVKYTFVPPDMVLVHTEDITERRRVEKALRESEKRYRGLFDHIPIGLYRTTPDGQLLEANLALVEMVGYPDRETLLSMSIPDEVYLNYEDRQRWQALLKDEKVVRNFEVQVRRYDGAVIWTQESARAIYDDEGSLLCYEGTVQDITARRQAQEELTRYQGHLENLVEERTAELAGIIDQLQREVTERKQTEEALRLSEERFAKAFYSNPVAIVISKLSGPIVDANDSYLRLMGYRRDEIIGRTTIELGMAVNPDDRPKVAQMLREQRSIRDMDLTVRTKSGEICEVVSSLELIELGGEPCVLAMFYDVTEIRRAEEALRKSEEKYRVLFELASDAIVFGRDVYADYNRKALELFGCSLAEELSGKRPFELSPPTQPDGSNSTEKSQQFVEKALAGEPQHFYWQHMRIDGSLVDTEVSLGRVELAGELWLIGILRDVTERRRMEEKLRESEDRYRELANSITDVFFAMDKDLRYTYWNRASEELTGVPAQDALGRSIYELFPDTPQTRNAEQAYRDVLSTQQPQTFVIEYQLGGRDFFFEISAYPSKDGISVFTKNVTERVQVERALQRSELRYRALFENAPMGIGLATPEGRVLVTNDAMAQMTGYSGEELRQVRLRDIYQDPEERALLLKRLQTDGLVRNYEVGLRRKDGTLYDANLTVASFALDGEQFLMTVVQDITEQKRAKEALKEREREIRVIAESIPALLSYVGADGHYRFVNKRYEEWFGIPRVEIVGKHYGQVLGETTQELIQDRVKAVLSGNRVRYEEILPYAHGGTRCVVADYVPDFDDQGRVKGFFALVTDITERKQMEEALRESEERYRSLFDGVPVGLYRTTPDGRILDMNQALLGMLGFSNRETALAADAVELYVNPEERARWQALMDREGVVRDFEAQWRRRDGSLMWARDSARVVRDDERRVLYYEGSVEDIAVRKRVEQAAARYRRDLRRLSAQVIKSQETERQRLSRELHDELGQALTAISINLAEIDKGWPPELTPTLKENLAETRSLADQILEQVRELSLDLRPSMLDDLGLVPALRWYVNRYVQRLNIGVKFEAVDLEERLSAEVETALYRIVQEGLTNIARHAQASKIRLRLEREESTVHAVIEDDGQGFDAQEIADFQAPQQGVGLVGIRERVDLLGGHFHIQSRPGHGTRLSIEIPT